MVFTSGFISFIYQLRSAIFLRSLRESRASAWETRRNGAARNSLAASSSLREGGRERSSLESDCVISEREERESRSENIIAAATHDRFDGAGARHFLIVR